MESIRHYIEEAIRANILCSTMEWDEKHGPTEEQWDAFMLLFPEAVKNAHERRVKIEGFDPPVCQCDSEGENWAYEPDLESLTCFKCPRRATCDYMDNPYNTNGDCLAMK